MKIVSRVLLLSLVCVGFPSMAVLAEPGASCGKAVSGTVPLTDGYCDLYARQLEYKKADKAFRESLEARRVSFETPRTQAIEKYRADLEALYKEESEEYQKQLALTEAKEAAALDEQVDAEAETKVTEPSPPESSDQPDETTAKKSDDVSTDDSVGEAEDDAEEAEGDKVGIKEKILNEDDEDPKVIKKAVMPEDAPPF